MSDSRPWSLLSRRPHQPPKLPVAFDYGFVDGVVAEPTGLVRVEGWATVVPSSLDIQLWSKGGVVPRAGEFRLYRPDVATSIQASDQFLGFGLEFLVRPPAACELRAGSRMLWRSDLAGALEPPAYDSLLNCPDVLGRSDIYGSGPPALHASEEVIALAAQLSGSVLDVGCGAGALMEALLSRGREVRGVEIDREEIRSSLLPSICDRVLLYGGGPLPFPDKSFDSVTLVEVLEHVDDYRAMLQEVSRVVRQKVLITVPDCSAIPRCFSQSVVPWHLLEATHLHFFNPVSLRTALQADFKNVELSCIGPVAVNSTKFFTSLAAVAEPRALA